MKRNLGALYGLSAGIGAVLLVIGLLMLTNFLPLAAVNFASSTSWNSRVTCTPSVVRITDITGNRTGSWSYGNSTFNPGISSPLGWSSARRWLTPGATPPGWISPGPGCTATNSKGSTVSTFVQINGLVMGGRTCEDTSTFYDQINGGNAFPGSASYCDNTGNLIDTAIVPNPQNGSCSSTVPTPDCYGKIHVEIDRNWLAAGYCGTGTSCDNRTLSTTVTPYLTKIDVQGFVFWDSGQCPTTGAGSGASCPNWHSFSGWELHPLTGWRLTPTNITPAISFNWLPNTPVVGQTVTFSATVQNPPSSYQVAWLFGDGAQGTGATVTHSYTSAGTFQVQAGVLNNVILASVTNSIVVNNPSPSLTVTSIVPNPVTATAGQPVIFTANLQGGLGPYAYAWNYGDGSVDSGNPVTHTFAGSGSYVVSVNVVDSSSPPLSASGQTSITVNPSVTPITGSFSWAPIIPTTGQVVTYTATVSGGTPPYTITWNFGDGSGPTTGTTATHVYSSSGNYLVTIALADSASPPNTRTVINTVTVQASTSGGGGGGSGTGFLTVPLWLPIVAVGAVLVVAPAFGLAAARKPR